MNFQLNSTQTSIKKFNKEKNGSNKRFHNTIGQYLWFYQQHNKTLRKALNRTCEADEDKTIFLYRTDSYIKPLYMVPILLGQFEIIYHMIGNTDLV